MRLALVVLFALPLNCRPFNSEVVKKTFKDQLFKVITNEMKNVLNGYKKNGRSLESLEDNKQKGLIEKIGSTYNSIVQNWDHFKKPDDFKKISQHALEFQTSKSFKALEKELIAIKSYISRGEKRLVAVETKLSHVDDFDGPVFGPVINGTEKLLAILGEKIQETNLKKKGIENQIATIEKKVESMEQRPDDQDLMKNKITTESFEKDITILFEKIDQMKNKEDEIVWLCIGSYTLTLGFTFLLFLVKCTRYTSTKIMDTIRKALDEEDEEE